MNKQRLIEVIAHAWVMEEAAQMGEPDPWPESLDDPRDRQVVEGWLGCASAAYDALQAAEMVAEVPHEGPQLRQRLLRLRMKMLDFAVVSVCGRGDAEWQCEFCDAAGDATVDIDDIGWHEPDCVLHEFFAPFTAPDGEGEHRE